MSKAPESHTKHPSEVRNVAVSFDALLDAGETITGTVTCTSTPTGLTFASAAASSGTLTINGKSVTAGRAVTFRVSGGVSGLTYQIEVSCGTTATPAQTLIAELELLVLDQ